MRDGTGLGEFEQLVLMAVLSLGPTAQAAEIRTRIVQGAKRSVSRGALYATLDRLERKGFLRWDLIQAAPARGGIPGRRFVVTSAGLSALRKSWAAVRTMARGLERLLGQA